MVLQIGSGLVLAFYYVRGRIAWRSVVEITREVSSGWLIRLIHSNTASFLFIILFSHFLRGLYYSSFYMKTPWLSGWLLIVLTIAAAFLGYVLPWGQISFWGATVIINLLRILPIGNLLVIWLWGGFYVSTFTCTFFFAIHYLVPFIVIGLIGIHLLILHYRGRSSSRSRALKIKFQELYLIKDRVNLLVLWLIWLYILLSPDWSADPVNFTVSDLTTSPLHIQPEWYFLHLYAVLRSIPNKLGGLVGFILALVLLLSLMLITSIQRSREITLTKLIFWGFIIRNLILLWLGSQPVEFPYVFMGQISTNLYFILLGIWLVLDQNLSWYFY